MIRKNDWIAYMKGLDKKTCDDIIKLAKEKLKKSDEEIHDRHIENYEDQEKTDIVWTDEQWIYDAVWPFMVEANVESGWKYEIHTAENMQIARYKKGMFYDWHPDGRGDHFGKYKNIANPIVHDRVRKLSMTVMLNDDYEGGEFQFSTYYHKSTHMEKTWKDRDTPDTRTDIVENNTGTVVIFPADMWHRVKPVTKGIRYSLAVWFLGPPYV